MWGTQMLRVPILGGDDLNPDLYHEGITHAFVGLGSCANMGPRKSLYEKAQRQGLRLITALHPQAIISPSAILGAGVAVRVGVIINTGAIVEHDCVTGDHAHIATGARLAGTGTVGAGAHVGAGATVRQSITIRDGSVVGIGAAVIRDVGPWKVVGGVPAQELRRSWGTKGVGWLPASSATDRQEVTTAPLEILQNLSNRGKLPNYC